MQATYDQIAPRFAVIHATMPPELITAARRFVELVGQGAHVLDLGCGAGRDTGWFLTQRLVVTGADLSGGMLNQAKSRSTGPLLQMNMRRLAFQTGTFQGLWCNAALLHLPKREAPAALAEMRRVLAPGGVFFLAVQAGSGEGWEIWSPKKPVKRFFARYSQTEVITLLTRHGFTIQEQAGLQGDPRYWLHFLVKR